MTDDVRHFDHAAQEGPGDGALEGDLGLERPSPEQVTHDIRSVFRGAVKTALELILEEVLREEVVGVGKWAHGAKRKDHYNGSYMRGLLTSMGYLEDVRMPRARQGGAPVDVIGRYKRRTDDVDAAITEAYVKGVSTRGMDDVVEALAGNGLGRSSVSRITSQLEAKVEALRSTKLEGPFPYLFLDATYFHARWARAVESVPALIAYGVNEEGKRQLLAVEIGTEESEDTWGRLIDGLLDRGLDGVQLVVSDAHEGLWAAVRKKLPEVPHQRCVVHLMRNVGSHVPHRLRKRVLGQVSAMFKSKSLKEAKGKLKRFQAKWTKELPEAVECLTNGFDAATRFYAFPRDHWPRLRSTNGLERLNREIKRRIKAVGAFPDRASALRLITAVAVDAAEPWSRRRYLDVSTLDL